MKYFFFTHINIIYILPSETKLLIDIELLVKCVIVDTGDNCCVWGFSVL